MTDHHDVIEAFVDNEPVAASDLGASLATPDGRDYLIDLLVLRGLVADGGTGLQTGGRAARTARSSAAQSRATGSKRGVWLSAAAALITVGLGAGFLAGRAINARSSPPAISSDSSAVDSTTTTTTAPAPTHVIRMEKGVDWNERSGGN